MKKKAGLFFLVFCVVAFSHSFSGIAQQSTNKKIIEEVNSDRKIESLDMLLVHVFGEPEFSGPNNGGLELRVSSAGDISLYLLGTVKVSGKTPSQAEKHIRGLLMNDYIRDPHVLVQVKSYRTSSVTVMGQVTKPGLIILPAEQRIDLLTGIAQAGGFTKLAQTRKIELTRKGVTRNYDLDDLKKEADPQKRVWLQSGDLIFVRESAF